MKSRTWKALFLTVVLGMSLFAQGIKVAAYETGKVKLALTSKSSQPEELPSLHKDTKTFSTVNMKKEPTSDIDDATYDDKLEVKEKRTENSKTYRLSDGSYVNETYFEPIHKKEGKQYVEIDNTLHNVSRMRSTPIYENKDGAYAFRIKEDTLTMENEDGNRLSFINQSANLSTYQIKDNVMLYSEAYPNIDMEYRLRGNYVTTHFIINGKTSCKKIDFTLSAQHAKPILTNDAITFVDEKNQVLFTYVKPVLYDKDTIAHPLSVDYKIQGNEVKVTIALNDAWINDEERIYPLTLASRVVDASKEINVTTAYNRSASPDITSNYYDLFVGYEDGAISGGTFLGVTRTYVQVSNLNLGADKEIVNAKLKLYKIVSEPQQWNTIAVGKTSIAIHPKDCTWNKRPSVSNISTTSVRKDAGWQEFDVTSYIQDVYKGKNTTIELKATNESLSYTPNVFSSESGTGMPKIMVQYRDAYDVDPSLSIDTFDAQMRIFSILNKGWSALSFDGIARPDTTVQFDLVKRGEDEVIKSETSKGKVSKYFIDPIYILSHIADTQNYEKENVNYTTDYIHSDAIPEFDVPYEYKVVVKGNNINSTTAYRSDSFIKYKVKNGDNLRTIASYYGLTIEAIKEDNNLKNDTIQEDDVLLLRFQKENDRVSSDIYKPPVKTVEYKATYVNRGPRCSSGTCSVIDPVNASTGNYYDEEKDFTIYDREEFRFLRYYNSMGPQLSGIFGNGFSSPIESYLSYDKKGYMLYFAGDGKIFQFLKTDKGYQSRKEDHLQIKQLQENIQIYNEDTHMQYTFDKYGSLETMKSPEGMLIQISYDAYGKIVGIHVGNKELTLQYNDRQLVKSITMPNGKSVQYSYDEQRNLTVFTDASGNKKTYTYDANNYLVMIQDKNHQKATRNTYDKSGRVVKQIDGNGNVSTLSYQTNQTILTKGNGSIETYTFNENDDIVKITQDGKTTSKYTYDDTRNILSYVNKEGETTTYTYEQNQLITTSYPDGTKEEYRYDAQGNIAFQKERDGTSIQNNYQDGNLISTTDEKSGTAFYEYDDEHRVVKETDAYGAVKTYTYEGAMISQITYSNSLIEYFVYDKNGNVIKESDNQGKVITYLYDADGNRIQKNYPDGTNKQWSYDANGNTIRYKDRIAGITLFTYDANNNLLTSQKGSLISSKTYNEINQIISETNEQGQTTHYTYDALGNKTSEIDKYGNKETYTYDGNGNITKITDCFGNSEINVYDNGNLIKKITKEGRITTYTYDSLNREIKRTNPNGTIETKEYKGALIVKETDEKGVVTEHFYDANQREVKTKITYPDHQISIKETKYDIYGNIIQVVQDGASESYTYDVYQQQIECTDALGNTTKKVYDFDGNVIQEEDALGNVVKTKYDGNKNIIAITDKNGNTETKRYNANGQLISETDALGYVKTYTYNKYGQLIEIIDPYNHKCTYSYDAYGNLIKTILSGKVVEEKNYDRHGREIFIQNTEEKTSFVYDDFDRIIKKHNEWSGLTVYTSYDRFGNIVKERDSEGLTTTYSYDLYQRKIKTKDAYGREESITYNIRDQVIKTKSFDGTSTSSMYDIRGNEIESIDALGRTTKRTYDLMNRLVQECIGSKILAYVYDANGQCIETKHTTRGFSTKTSYDKNGNVIEKIDALGKVQKTEYDAKNQAVATIDANQNRSTKEYDAYGNVIKETDSLKNSRKKVYNAYGLLSKEIDERGFETSYVYNDDFLVTEIIDGKRNRTHYDYNDAHQKISETNAIGGQTTYAYDAYGRESEVVYPSGKKVHKTYDALGNVIKEIDGKKVTLSTYDKRGRLIKSTIQNITQFTNRYNRYNQLIQTTDALGNISEYAYDQDGNRSYANEKGAISEKFYDEDGNIIKHIDNKTRISEFYYDGNNRLLKTIVNGYTTIHKTYDGNGNEIRVLEDGVETHNRYDACNHLIQVEVPSSSNANTFVTVQRIEYDKSGNIISVTDANDAKETKKYDANNNVIEETNKKGYISRYEYDGMNNMIKAQNHEERYVDYVYDQAGNLKRKILPNGFAEYRYDEEGNLLIEKDEYGYTNRYEYDVFQRKTKWIKSDGTVITYRYDKLGNKIVENDMLYTYDERGNCLTSTNKEGTVYHTYNAFNQKTSTKDSTGKIISYVYNHDNLLSEKRYAGITLTYTYTEDKQMDTVHKDGKEIASYRYNARNEVIEIKQNNIKTTKSYDDMGRLLTQKSQQNKVVIYDAAYTYDANDNLIEEVINGKMNTYTYNDYDELASSKKYVDGHWIKTTYSYDLYGNQITNSSTQGVSTAIFNDKNQIERIKTKEGIIRFTYDDNGNIAKKINADGRIDRYTYDEFNQLTTLEQGQYVYEYRYDAENVRIAQKITDRKDYHYDVWYDYTEPQAVVSKKRWKDAFKELKEQVKRKEKTSCEVSGKDSYDVSYHKKSQQINYLVDRNNEYTKVIKENDTTYVYGQELLASNDETIISGWNESVIAKIKGSDVKTFRYSDYGSTKDITSGYGYNGEQKDRNGLLYLRARYYDPSTARFIQIDTHYDGEKENIASQNRYAYTMNNPYKYVDRDGLKAKQKKTKVDKVIETTMERRGNATTYVTRYASGRRETRTVIKKSNEVIKWTGSSSVPTMYYGTSAMKQAMQGVGMARNITSGKGGGSSSNNPTTKKVNVTAKCPEKEWTDYVSDFLGGIKNYFVDSWNSVEGIYDTVKAKGIVGTIKMLYDTAEEYIKNFSLDDAIAIYNMYTKYNITIDKIITWIKCDFDVDKMANEYGYESFGDWYGRNIAEGTTAIAITKMADKLKTKYFKGKETNGAKDIKIKDIPNMKKQDIIKNIPDDWSYTENNGFVHIRDSNGKMRIRIDPADKVTQYPHVHIYDESGNLLDINGNVVDRKSPDGHIPYEK